LYKELKVSQFGGAVAELSAYHHGETSMYTTIIGMAQNIIGKNNINLLYPAGQFGKVYFLHITLLLCVYNNGSLTSDAL
jgi:DNA gyrase/topoisomerase IV subunit A